MFLHMANPYSYLQTLWNLLQKMYCIVENNWKSNLYIDILIGFIYSFCLKIISDHGCTEIFEMFYFINFIRIFTGNHYFHIAKLMCLFNGGGGIRLCSTVHDHNFMHWFAQTHFFVYPQGIKDVIFVSVLM